MYLQEESSVDPLKEVSAYTSLHRLYICKWLPSSKALKCMLNSQHSLATAMLLTLACRLFCVRDIHTPSVKHMCPFWINNSSLCPTGPQPGVRVRFPPEFPAPAGDAEDDDRAARRLQLCAFCPSFGHH